MKASSLVPPDASQEFLEHLQHLTHGVGPPRVAILIGDAIQGSYQRWKPPLFALSNSVQTEPIFNTSIELKPETQLLEIQMKSPLEIAKNQAWLKEKLQICHIVILVPIMYNQNPMYEQLQALRLGPSFLLLTAWAVSTKRTVAASAAKCDKALEAVRQSAAWQRIQLYQVKQMSMDLKK